MTRWFLFCALAAACGEPVEAPRQLLPISAEPNFTLHVSNQSFAIDPVDVTVTIDGQPAARGDYEVEGQHSWHQFRFRLSPGEHTLVATSQRGGATLEESITIDRPRYAALAFWYYPKGSGSEPTPRQLSLFVAAEPIGFD